MRCVVDSQSFRSRRYDYHYQRTVVRRINEAGAELASFANELQVSGFINKHLLEKFYMEGDQRVDLRDKIFREVVANCSVHREYTSAYPTELLITKGEVRITNPNRPLFHGFINRNDFAPYPKNPNLRKFFTAFGWTEEIGSGVRNTSRYLPLYSDGALPTFEEKEIFVTRLPLMHYTFGMYALKLSKWLSLPVDASEHLEKALATMEVPERLHDATFEDVLMDLVPSWVEKGTKLLHKKLWYVVGVLSLCGQPTSLAQLMAFFDYKNRKTFRENYMNPLRSLGFIEPTIPDKQSAPDTKYVITELGRAFLMGNR